MASAKRIAVQILRAIGKGFLYFGKGLWWLTKGIGNGILTLYRNYQEQRRMEEMQRQHDREIIHENYLIGKGWAEGVAEVNEEVRIRRQNERAHREQIRRLNKFFEPPKTNSNFFVQDFEPRKKKKKRSIFDLI